VHPLDDAWRSAIDATLHARGWPAIDDVARLGPLVAKLSASYNLTGTAARELLAARLAFSFARDVPKGGAAVRELVATGLLSCPSDRPLRVLDLGAGLGATSWGVARALDAAGRGGAIDATWVDADAAALAVGAELVRARTEAGGMGVSLRVKTIVGAVAAPRGEPFDLVLMGQVLSELDAGATADERVAKHVALVRDLLAHATLASGSVVIVEPALRDRTRHLHAVRDALLASAAEDVTVFAPCLHRHPCPARAVEAEWCHEDLPVDLPEWLVPIARAARLRWQGLTFSYLVLRRDGAALSARGFPWRVVSAPIVTKGKRELFLCGALDDARAARVRVQRLDRHATDANGAWEALARGDRIRTSPPLLSGGRGGATHQEGASIGKIGPASAVDVDRPRE
jgi:hypothetical protein